MKVTEELKTFAADLLRDGKLVCQTHVRGTYEPDFRKGYCKLLAGCRLLIVKLGSFGNVWSGLMPRPEDDSIENVMQIYGAIEAIHDALEKGRLSTIQELVTAEILTDLLEQAEVLLAAKYHRAAAIILRTILEERLRKLCEANGCFPTAAKPTIEHYKQALYAATIIDKIVQKKIDWMAGVGNSAAHNLPEYRDEDVPALYKDTRDFLARFSA